MKFDTCNQILNTYKIHTYCTYKSRKFTVLKIESILILSSNINSRQNLPFIAESNSARQTVHKVAYYFQYFQWFQWERKYFTFVPVIIACIYICIYTYMYIVNLIIDKFFLHQSYLKICLSKKNVKCITKNVI